jgi:hypothetical protein
MNSKERAFISFGGGSEQYYQRVHQLCNKVSNLNYFTQVIPYSHNDLINDSDFWSKYGVFMSDPRNRRGFGFWIWKPYLILKTLESLNDGDFLVYADAGCDINSNGLKRLDEYQEMLENNEYGLITFHLEKNREEIKYSKRILLDYMNTVEEDKQSPQIMATVLIMKKTSHTLNHMKSLLNIASSMNYNLINNVLSLNEYSEFQSHRNDQSIHSLYVKSILRNDKNPKPIIIPDETYFEPNWNTDGITYPIWARRFRNPV